MRYMLVTDNDSHWYIIPTQHLVAWGTWTELNSELPESWNPPIWARPVGGSPTLVTFENPVVGW